ncbi:leucine-rich repeat receptor-like serine/threonine-protein kinase RGI4 [Andrographis paniculata]|uniref:leucine-rich repeat receptor-like serine/threonine-protein kinase RGI4 n=1 Tax=Andrographis paniculata TaxID=175694 RepID=UPI0021E8B83F|nr:leucine-rich repeat receptor-like serine/threonine-protein kinase RGI4 [Andrographis paniculata]
MPVYHHQQSQTHLLPWPLLFLPFLLPVSSLNSQGQTLLSWSLIGAGAGAGGWDAGDPTPCRWPGVGCNFNNEIINIDLRYIDIPGGVVPSNFTSLNTLIKLVVSGANLTGQIPSEILGGLPELKILDLSDNGLTGVIPDWIFRLPKLEKLLLNANRLEGSVPDSIGNLTALVELAVFDNRLSGRIPASIGDLKRLQVIRAGGNKNLEGPVPPEIGNCTELAMLGLAETSVSGALPAAIGRLKKLETLAIYTSLISGWIPEEIGDCIALRNVYLYENSLSGSIPSQLGKLRSLQSLLLWQNNLVGTIPPEIGRCRELIIVDLSMNSLTGSIPASIGNLSCLRELQASLNQISGEIPAAIGNCTALTHIELDNNQIAGSIPPELGNLPNLTLLFLWQNRLEGNIPASLSACRKLEAIDLSQNSLIGNIPGGVFDLQNLNKLLLLSNNLSGSIPPEIGNCSSLIRFRAGNNKLTGNVPPEIGRLKNLNFLDLGLNRLSGSIPVEISGCRNLTFLDLHSNFIAGNLPANLNRLVNLQFLDISDNLIEGALSPSLGSLNSVTKFVVRKNKMSGSIPSELGSCSRLQLLDLSDNSFDGRIPGALGTIPAMEISLNLSCNKLTGGIPMEFAQLDRLGALDISFNELSGDLHYISGLQNLVVLNVSHNNFTGDIPDTPFFAKLPLSALSGNPELCLSQNGCDGGSGDPRSRGKAARVAMVVLLCIACVLLLSALYIILGGRIPSHKFDSSVEGGAELGPPWEVTLYQKLDLSIIDVAKCLTDINVIGHGQSGTVYRATIGLGSTVAVKQFRVSDKHSASTFSSEIATLARIRHRNIVRLLGFAANRKNKLLFYDYLPNGTLAALLHDGCSGRVDWEIRFKIALGVAEGLAYLHHDCVPPILHRDIKTDNILLGDRYEPCLADFGLARFLEDDTPSFSAYPQFAGSYGYFAPEYASMVKITEKSDIYSYGVVLLEIITGKKPVDPSLPEGQHIVQWARDHLKSKRDPVDIIDPKLHGHLDEQIQETLQTLGIALLCTSNRPEDRPMMKDVVALLTEIRHEQVSSGHDQAPKPAARKLPGSPARTSPNHPPLPYSSSSTNTVEI